MTTPARFYGRSGIERRGVSPGSAAPSSTTATSPLSSASVNCGSVTTFSPPSALPVRRNTAPTAARWPRRCWPPASARYRQHLAGRSAGSGFTQTAFGSVEATRHVGLVVGVPGGRIEVGQVDLVFAHRAGAGRHPADHGAAVENGLDHDGGVTRSGYGGTVRSASSLSMAALAVPWSATA